MTFEISTAHNWRKKGLENLKLAGNIVSKNTDVCST